MGSSESVVETLTRVLQEGLRSGNYVGMLNRLRTLVDSENDDVLKFVAARTYLTLLPDDDQTEKWQANGILMEHTATPERARHMREARKAVEDLLSRVAMNFRMTREANPGAPKSSLPEG